MHSNSGNIEIMINDKVDEITKGFFESLLSRYQIYLQESMKGSDFTFDYVHFLYFKHDKINSILDGSYIYSPDWTKNKKAKTNPINKD